MKPIKVYADTSVYGGVYDEEFADASLAFFEQVREGRFALVVSAVVRDELEDAPQHVRDFFADIAPLCQTVDPTEDALLLQGAYMAAGIIGEVWQADALHVALATIAECRLIVSWNFRHIVHFQKIPMYNGVNESMGYSPLAIHTPQEVTEDDDEDQDV